MNPPFSTSPNMAKRNRQAVFMHVRSAMDRLADSGRLVAIAPHWFNPEMCDSFKRYPAQLQLSAYIPGSAYRYHGTTMETRLLVFDKIENSGPVKSVAPKFEDLLEIVQDLPARQPMPRAHLALVPTPKALAPKSEQPQSLVQLALVPSPVVRKQTRTLSLPVIPVAGFHQQSC